MPLNINADAHDQREEGGQGARLLDHDDESDDNDHGDHYADDDVDDDHLREEGGHSEPVVYNGECGVRVNGHVEDDIPDITDGQGAVMVVL